MDAAVEVLTGAAPRLLIAGTGSGCGKTTVTCALLQALADRGHKPASFKCGPDYIDPMFHTEAIGTPSANIDLFFAGEELARALFLRHASELNVIEGVMGFYDGLSMEDTAASAYHVAKVLSTPAVLVVNARGMGLSVSAVVKGYMSLRGDAPVRGVILNHTNAMTYPKLKTVIERECGVHVYGFMPECPECALESRHLGLVTAQEIGDLKDKLHALAQQAEKTVEIDTLIELMRSAPELNASLPEVKPLGNVRIAVARDKAFCFYYRDNLELLERLGAELVPFSPVNDAVLPLCDGLWLGGGYPELYAEKLSENKSMCASIREAVSCGLPTVAECGGFMYLCGTLEGREMVGVFPYDCANTGRLARFGYITLMAQTDSLLFEAGDTARAHEFHYWDATDSGSALSARKPNGRGWNCAHVSENLYAGYPHLYLWSAPKQAERFVQKCIERKRGREEI